MTREAPCLHKDVAVTVCTGELVMHLTRSPIRGYEFLVVLKCPVCDLERDIAPPVEVRGVLPEDAVYWTDDTWEHEDDGGGYV